MGLQSSGKMSIGNQLKAHYDKILYPYDVWKSNQGKKKSVSCLSCLKLATLSVDCIITKPNKMFLKINIENFTGITKETAPC